MLIAIDASRALPGYATGVEFYSKYIIDRLIDRMLEVNADAGRGDRNQIMLYTPSKITHRNYPEIPANQSPRAFFAEHPKEIVAQKVVPGKRLWTQLHLARELYKNPPAVLFVPSHVLPRFFPEKIRAVTMIHDVAFKHLPKVYSSFAHKYLDYTTKYTLHKAAAIITPSQATKEDLIKFYKADPEKITVIPHGAPARIAPDQSETSQKAAQKSADASTSPTEKILAQFHLKPGDNYFLYVGRLEAKKNISRMIKAFTDFAKNHPDWKFILAGNRGQGFAKILKEYIKSPAQKNIIMPGYITGPEKAALFQHAQALIFTSLYEGFGIPILEAFQYDLPVITSNSSAMPEVCGAESDREIQAKNSPNQDIITQGHKLFSPSPTNGSQACLLVDPLDPTALTQAMKKLATQPDYRAQLIAHGQTRLKAFSWTKSAEETWKILVNH